MTEKLTPERQGAFRHLLSCMVNSNEALDAIKAMRLYQSAYDVTVDWHEFSYLLDYLNQLGVLEIAGHSRDGMTQYRVVSR